MNIRNKTKLLKFFKASGITVIAGLLIGVAGLSALTLRSDNRSLIALIVSTRNNPFFADIISAAEQEISKHPDYRLQVFDSVDKDDEQVKNIDSAIGLGAEAVLINVVNSTTAANAGVSKLIANDIPVIAIDRGIDIEEGKEGIDLTIASDNVQGANALATHFEENILVPSSITLQNDSIFQLRGTSGSQASTDRNDGFREVLGNWISGDGIIANFNRAEGNTATANFLATDTNKNTKVIFAENDEMALGAVGAIESAGGFSPYVGNWTEYRDGKIYVLGFDGTFDALEAIRDNRMYATVIQQPKEMGRIAIDETIKYFNSQEQSFPNDFIAAETVVVDKSNVGEYLD